MNHMVTDRCTDWYSPIPIPAFPAVSEAFYDRVPKSHPSTAGPWDTNSEKTWMVVNGEGQIIFWSCLACALNYTHDGSQFKRYFFCVKNVDFFRQTIKWNVFCEIAQWTTHLLSDNTHHQYRRGRQLGNFHSIFVKHVVMVYFSLETELSDTSWMSQCLGRCVFSRAWQTCFVWLAFLMLSNSRFNWLGNRAQSTSSLDNDSKNSETPCNLSYTLIHGIDAEMCLLQPETAVVCSQ